MVQFSKILCIVIKIYLNLDLKWISFAPVFKNCIEIYFFRIGFKVYINVLFIKRQN
jgi:hypothetical protein